MSVNATNSQNSCGTCGETSPGTGAELTQNNVPRTIRISYRGSEIVPALVPSNTYVKDKLNVLERTFTEIETPILIRLTESQFEGTPTSHIFLFLGGKGTYGGLSPVAFRESHLMYLTTINAQIEDIEESSNTVFIDLGVLPNANYLIAANGEGRDLSDPNKIYFFTYIKDGNNYLIKFEGPNGYYGGEYENQLVAANLIPSISSADPVQIDTSQTITYSFHSPETIRTDYFPTALSIRSIQTIGVASLAYSNNNGASYSVIALPLANPFVVPAGWVNFRITYQVGTVRAGVNLTT